MARTFVGSRYCFELTNLAIGTNMFSPLALRVIGEFKMIEFLVLAITRIEIDVRVNGCKQ